MCIGLWRTSLIGNHFHAARSLKNGRGVEGDVSNAGNAGGVGRRLFGSEVVVTNGARVGKVVVVLALRARGSDG